MQIMLPATPTASSRCANVWPTTRRSVSRDSPALPVEDILRLAREYATATPAVIRMNYGVQRSQNGGTAARAIAMLPCLTGAWKHLGGGLQLSTSGAFQFNKQALERPDLAAASPIGRPGTRREYEQPGPRAHRTGQIRRCRR